MDFARSVVDEFLEDLELFNENEESKLKQRIQDPAYFRNFTALARSIAPDGEAVTTVGFSALRNGKRRDVALVKTHAGVSEEALPQRAAPNEPIQVLEGRLKAADAIRETKNQIKVLSDRGGKPQIIVVPEGIMADIVRPMWGEEVRVTARRRRGTLELVDIKKLRIRE
jgi:hypothetical protein